ncbi:Hypothetical protein KVN_LOCUS120 [uncultured virus]|nr:Hypothetical protein KVN_LOCUS120 [uncultured virus]
MNTNKWTKLHSGNGIVPSPRAFFCWHYDKINDLFYLQGGKNYFSDTIKGIAFYNDTWKFDFSTNKWTQIFLTIFPSSRASSSCDAIGNSLFLYGGNFENNKI